MFDKAAEFFRAPAAVKQAARFSGAAENRGFIGFGGETLDPGKPPDMKEAFNIGFELAPDDSDLLAKQPFLARNLWPDVAGFRAAMLAYFDHM